MKPYIIIFVVLLAKSVNGQDCPTKTELETESGYPNIFQINSTAVSVDWSELWPSLDWTSSCVEGLEKRKLWMISSNALINSFLSKGSVIAG